MRIGSLQIRSPIVWRNGQTSYAHEDAKPKKPDLGVELGFAGTKIWLGVVEEEFDPDLKGAKALDEFDRMLRNDGQVQALEFLLTLPLLSAEWFVEPGSDSPTAKEAADLIDSVMGFSGRPICKQSWREHLSEALNALFYGFAPFELVFAEKDGKIVWHAIQSIHPRAVERFDFDDDGSVKGLFLSGIHPTKGWMNATLPAEKLLLYTWRKRFRDPTGLSILRPGYIHSKSKRYVLRIGNVGIERFAVGALWGRYPRGTMEDDQNKFLAMLKAIRSHEQGAFITPEDYTVEVLKALEGSGHRILVDWIQLQDEALARSVLGQFIMLGTTETGSRALGESFVQVFLMAENAIGDKIAETFQSAIRQLVLLNFPGLPDDEMPKLVHQDVAELLSPRQFWENLEVLVQNGLLSWRREDEERLRKLRQLPPLPEEETEEASSPPPPVIYQRATDEAKRRQRQEDEFAKMMRERLEKVQEQASARLAEIVVAYQKASDLQKGTVLAQLSDFELTGRRDYEQMIRRFLFGVFETARKRIAEELNISADQPIPNAIRTFINVKAETIARKHFEELRTALIMETMDVMRANLPPALLRQNAAAIFAQRVNTNLRDWLDAGDELVSLLNEAMNRGAEGQP